MLKHDYQKFLACSNELFDRIELFNKASYPSLGHENEDKTQDPINNTTLRVTKES